MVAQIVAENFWVIIAFVLGAGMTTAIWAFQTYVKEVSIIQREEIAVLGVIGAYLGLAIYLRPTSGIHYFVLPTIFLIWELRKLLQGRKAHKVRFKKGDNVIEIGLTDKEDLEKLEEHYSSRPPMWSASIGSEGEN